MTTLNKTPGHIEILIHDYLKGNLLESDKDELFRWLAQDASNVIFFNQVADIWLSASVFQKTEDFNSDEAFNRVKAKISQVNTLAPEKRILTLSWLKVAAILIPFMLLSSLVTKMLLTPKVLNVENPYSFEVPYGSKSKVILPDGTQVVLNSGSKLLFKEGFGNSHRSLDLSGEGYFNVAKNKELPFVVHAGNLFVRALGTEFNVKAYPEEKNIETILIEGAIQVSRNIEEGKKEKLVDLLPKQQLVYNKTVDSIYVNVTEEKDRYIDLRNLAKPAIPTIVFEKTKVDPIIYTTWKDDSWSIYRKTLLDLATELERKYDVTIVFENESLRKIKFSGTLRDESIEQVLSAIRLASPIDFKINGKMVNILEDKDLMKEYTKYFSN